MEPMPFNFHCCVDTAHVICGAVVIVTAIVVAGLILQKLIEHIADSRKTKHQHLWEEESKKEKQRANLIEKKLTLMLDLCVKKNDKGEKENDTERIKKYLDEIDSLLGVEKKQTSND